MRKTSSISLFISVFLPALIWCVWAQPNTPAHAGTQKVCTPEITNCLPDGFIEDRYPTISAVVTSPCGAAIDTSSITMTLNDFPLTPTITGDGPEVTVSFIPDFREGLAEERPHNVVITCQDTNGEKAKIVWEFFIPILY